MSRAEEAAHLGVINNSLRDHRHYTEKGRVAEERNHRTSAEREQGEEAGGNKTQLWKRLVDISRITTRVAKLLLLKLHYPLNSRKKILSVGNNKGFIMAQSKWCGT